MPNLHANLSVRHSDRKATSGWVVKPNPATALASDWFAFLSGITPPDRRTHRSIQSICAIKDIAPVPANAGFSTGITRKLA